MSVILLLTLSLFVVSHATIHHPTITTELNNEWETFKLLFKKEYEPIDEIVRRVIWEENLRYIQNHNLEADLGKHTFTLGLNQFADLTNEEFKSKYLSKNFTRRRQINSKFVMPYKTELGDVEVDWRQKGAVTPVKNQYACNAGWAFAATGACEGRYARQTGVLMSFSEQQLIDCTNYGCNGGLPDEGFEYYETNGINNEETYPYIGPKNRCKYNNKSTIAHVVSIIDVEHFNEIQMAAAVKSEGPLAAMIDASRPTFQFYNGGIYNDPTCSKTIRDQGVLIVGYGESEGEDYWIVKNSWGAMWGDRGYIKMIRDGNNQCGIASETSFPILRIP